MTNPKPSLLLSAMAFARPAILPAVFSLAMFSASVARADLVANYWVNWTGAPGSYPNTMVTPSGNANYATLGTGTLFDPNTSQTINITYSGEIYSLSEFNNPSGTDWFNYPGAYLSDYVTTLPPRGNFIAVTGYSGLVNTITFSSPVTNLLMAIGSLGRFDLQSTLVFDKNATVISSGAGLYGNGPLTMSGPSTLVGNEGNGMIQFTGTFSSLSWTIPNEELYMVYNIGISNVGAAAVPEPGQVAASLLLLAGIGGYVWMKRRKAAKISAPAAA
jgi:hypothetical protein